MNSVNAFFVHLSSWRAILDICLITGGIFFLYRTLMRLGTWKIFMGICIAFVFFVLASVLNLEGVEWVFKNISHVAVLAMIVIFQPELRKIFEKIVSLYRQDHKENGTDFVTELAESLWKMGKERCGALVVIPGRELLNDKLSGGYSLNADISSPLILSIFDHHSPGHDGALIIENNKLTRFGVRLPISVSGRLGDDYGTRHHAGMGLSEQSDALAFVVSEERGKVSVFSGGEMRELESPQHIIDTIADHQHKHGLNVLTKKRGVNRLVLVQLGLCLLVALVFWSSLVVVNKQIIERVISVPVEYTVPGAGLVLVGDKVDNVKVHVTGTKSDLETLIASHIAVKVDLAEMGEGKRSVLISKENLRLPKDITLLDSDPTNLEVTLAGIVQKTVPIVPQLIGKLPAGQKMKSIKLEPEMVQVLAPPDRDGYKTINISTTPVYLNSIESTSTLFCKVIAPPSMQPVDKKWPDVKITIQLEE